MKDKIGEYWGQVAGELDLREEEKVLAGDDDYYYRYKRKKFLQQLSGITKWKDKSVLEYGCGPGGNLKYLNGLGVNTLTGVDVSGVMLKLARKNTADIGKVNLFLNDGKDIPVEGNSKDIVFTSTVLQHNVNDGKVAGIIRELCRVSSDIVLLCEDTSPKRRELHAHFVSRPVDFYKKQVEENGYEYQTAEFLDIQISYYALGSIRKLFSLGGRKEGEPLSSFGLKMQKYVWALTKRMDPLYQSEKGLTLMLFRKKS